LRLTVFLGFGKSSQYPDIYFSGFYLPEIFKRLVQEPRSSFPSPAEFTAPGGKFSVSGEVGAETEVSAPTLLLARATWILEEIQPFGRARDCSGNPASPPHGGLRNWSGKPGFLRRETPQKMRPDSSSEKFLIRHPPSLIFNC
jgi:hypothetical protein